MIVENEFYIGYSDIGADYLLKNSALLSMFEDVAGIHATMAGEGLPQTETTWLLTGYKVNFVRRPAYGERVTVRTWGTELKGITAAREFEAVDKNGLPLAYALSNWAHINIEKRCLEKAGEGLAQAYGVESEKTNFGEKRLKRLGEPENCTVQREFFVDRNWIDANNHMNNIHYTEAVEMTLPAGFSCGSFEIMYKKEITYGETIVCRCSQENGVYTAAIKSRDLSELHAVVVLR